MSTFSDLALLAEDAEDARVNADPAISAADLEEALESFFKTMGYRNLEEVVQLCKQEKVGWKTAPKAMAGDVV